MRVASLHRYPVKGLSPERLARADLPAGGHVKADRLFAVENGPSGFDEANPTHLPKTSYLTLMRHEGLARIRAAYDDASDELGLTVDGEAVRADLGTQQGRALIEAFLARHVPSAEARGPFRILRGRGGYRFTDSRSGYVSLLNAASVQDLEARLGAPVDPLRFRANILLEGLAPWAEFALVGQVIEAPSGLRLKVLKPIDRCAATSVDPVTGARDLPVVKALMKGYGHVDCGVYAEIVRGGVIAEGHRLAIAPSEEPRLGF